MGAYVPTAFAVDLGYPPPAVDPANAAFNHVVVSCYNDSGHCQDGYTAVFYFNDSTWTISGTANCTDDNPNGCSPDSVRVTVGSQNAIGGMNRTGGSPTGFYVGFPSNGPSGSGSPSNVFAKYACDRDLTNCTRSTGGNESYPLFPPNTYYSDLNYIQNGVIRYAANATLPDTRTRFTAVLPTASSTVSTSTPVAVGASIYINEDEYEEGNTFIVMTFTNNSSALGMGSALQAWDAAFGNIRIPVTDSGTFSSSTLKSFNLTPGKVNASYRIVVENCYFFGIFCGSDTVLAASSTYFYVGQKTQFDIDQEAGNLGIFGLAPGSDAFTGTSTSLFDCDVGTSFKIDKCLWSIVFPNQELIISDLKTLSTIPIVGYLPRMIDIWVNTTATTSLPIISYTFSNNNSAFGGLHLQYDPWSYFWGANNFAYYAVADDGSGKNVWDIVGPAITIIVRLTLLFVIIKRLTGINWGRGNDWSQSESINVSDTTAKGGTRTTHTFTKRRKL